MIMNGNNVFEGMQEIDLRKIFREKNPGLAPYIPGFIYNYLNRILHIKEINAFLKINGNKKDYNFIEAVIDNFNVTTNIQGDENLPESGRFIFASNHPLGGFDGLLLIKLIFEKYCYLKCIINDILMNIKNIESFFVPINKHGSQSANVAKQLDEIMRSDAQILTFPAGLVSRKRKGRIRDIPWKKNFISKAVQYKRDIIPVHVTGRCTDFFYRLANFRKFLGIKSNIEMFFLPDETFRHKNKHFTITIGPVISWQTFDTTKKPAEWALLLQDFVYSMPNDYHKPFTPDE